MKTDSATARAAAIDAPPNFKGLKLDRIAKLLKWRNRFRREEALYNCLTKELAELAGVEDTENVSRNSYDPSFEKIILQNPSKVILDVGAGYRPIDYQNVVNLEIVRYPTTDVLGVAEALPFKSGVFDYVHSNAVLEHVRNPFRCAEEIVRVLKPGGVFWIAVPFLQPYHGYPHHYYNMTHSGIKNLFAGKCEIVEQSVPTYYHPIHALEWFTRQYTWRLSEEDKEAFLNMKISDIGQAAMNPDGHGFVRNLPEESQFELCSGSLCVGRKI
nr:methyltransferase domain-containing protein [uncultured Achromobacter sp.]